MREARRKRFVFVLILSGLFTACISARTSNPKNVSAVGLKVPKKGVTIDATYDKRLDNLIPGYKVVTIALTNNSFEILKLNPLKDRWFVEDAEGKKRRAINSLRIKDPSIFGKLPDQLKKLIDYPNGVSVGYTETFDVFFSHDVELQDFRSVGYYSAALDENFDIVSIANDDPRHQPADPYVNMPEDLSDGYKDYDNHGPIRKLPTKGTFKKIKSAGN